MNPLNGASPVPGPTIITGVVDRNGSLNWDFLTYKEPVYILYFFYVWNDEDDGKFKAYK